MKQTAIRENHLYSKAYARGKKQSARNLTVYVLRDTHAGLLKRQNPQKQFLNRVGLTVSKRSEELSSETARSELSARPIACATASMA